MARKTKQHTKAAEEDSPDTAARKVFEKRSKAAKEGARKRKEKDNVAKQTAAQEAVANQPSIKAGVLRKAKSTAKPVSKETVKRARDLVDSEDSELERGDFAIASPAFRLARCERWCPFVKIHKKLRRLEDEMGALKGVAGGRAPTDGGGDDDDGEESHGGKNQQHGRDGLDEGNEAEADEADNDEEEANDGEGATSSKGLSTAAKNSLRTKKAAQTVTGGAVDEVNAASSEGSEEGVELDDDANDTVDPIAPTKKPHRKKKSWRHKAQIDGPWSVPNHSRMNFNESVDDNLDPADFLKDPDE